jgi:hypothetical protein
MIAAGRAVVRWLKDQSWWLGTAAAIASALTFYFNIVNRGSLQVFLPDDVGVEISDQGRPIVHLPIAIANTGAARTRHVVRRVEATLADAGNGDPRTREHALRWTQDSVFLGRDAYFQKYPGRDPRGKPDAGQAAVYDDYFDYGQRAVPFVVNGAASVSKILKLEPRGTGTLSSVGRATLRVEVTSDRDTYTASAAYDCKGAPGVGKGTQWCSRTD